MAKKDKTATQTASTDTTVTSIDKPQAEAVTLDSNGLARWPYKLSGDIPERLRGKIIQTRDCNGNLDKMHLLVEDGKSENVAKLAQAQYDIIVQRKLRDAAASEDVSNILAGKVVEINGEALDFAGMSETDRDDYCVGLVQEVADSWVYGARTASLGGGAKAKAAVATVSKLKADAAADPELAAKLAVLGYTL